MHLQDKLANANDRAKAAEECKLMLDEQMKVSNSIEFKRRDKRMTKEYQCFRFHSFAQAYIAAYEGSAKDLVDARGLIHDLKDQVCSATSFRLVSSSDYSVLVCSNGNLFCYLITFLCSVSTKGKKEGQVDERKCRGDRPSSNFAM